MFVLGGPPATADPATSGYQWEFLGPIRGMDMRQWAIDGTVIEVYGKLYFVYSGWPEGEMQSDLEQRLFILRLSDPATADSRAIEICKPEEKFEWTDNHGINEGEYDQDLFPL